MADQFELGRTSVAPSEVIIHDDWNPHVDRYNDDIAVILMERQIQFTGFIRPICLWVGDGDPGVLKGTVAGWGKNENGGVYNENIPTKLEIPIIQSNGKCYQENYLLAKIGSDKSFCAGREGVGVCQGDSGSGFIVRHNSRFYFKGIVSSSLNDPSGCYTENYAIYTDVTKYKSFISNPKGTNSNTETCGQMTSSSSLVIGGKLSSRDQFPWVVSIFRKIVKGFEHKGAGSLISARHVVATPNSVGNHDKNTIQFVPANTDNIRLYFGSTNFNSSVEPGSIFVNGVKRIAVHPEVNYGPPRSFDIAVVTLKKPIAFSTFVSPVCLWNFGSIDDQVGETAYGVGYGWDENRTMTGVRKHVPMTIHSMEKCKSYWSEVMKIGSGSEYFCAIGHTDNIVHGHDYPLYLKKDGKWFLRGLMITWISLNIDGFKPVFYENTAKFVEWIDAQMNVE